MASVEPTPQRWTSERYFSLVTAGELRPEDRVELLEGVVVSMSPQTPRHASCVSALNAALGRACGERAHVRVQLPLLAGTHSVPEPDLAVVPGRPLDHPTRHPAAALLVVEVADSSLAQDRLTKAAIYAAAGVPEYWIANLIDDRIEVFRTPEREAARYAEVSGVGRGQRIEILGLPGVVLAVDELLPAR